MKATPQKLNWMNKLNELKSYETKSMQDLLIIEVLENCLIYGEDNFRSREAIVLFHWFMETLYGDD